MSKFNKIAVAVAASLVVPAAFAVSVTIPTVTSAPFQIGNVDVADAETVVAVNAMSINVEGTDLIIGRTVGFSVRIDLAGDATFDAAGLPTVGAALGTDVTTDPDSTDSRWTVTRAAGGAGQSFVVYSVQPGSDSVGVINGAALVFAAGDLQVTDAANLGTAGGTVSATVTFADPGTAQPILTPRTATILQSRNPLNYTVSEATNPNARINVASGTGFNSKTRFSNNGEISATGNSRYFDAGRLQVGVVAATRAVGSTEAFQWADADRVAVTLTGLFSAFAGTGTGASAAGVYLLRDASASCGDSEARGETALRGQVSATGVSFAAANFSTLAQSGAGTGTARICFVAPGNGTTNIDATTVSTQVTVTRNATGKSVSGTAAAMSMAYNGPVVDVDHFNPASNTNQQSYLRISNPSAVDGQANIAGYCDNGEAKAAVHVPLAAGNSVLVTAADLENGNAAKGIATGMGACATGKTRLIVTGEFAGMKVQNFLRNENSSGMVNTNVNTSDQQTPVLLNK